MKFILLFALFLCACSGKVLFGVLDGTNTIIKFPSTSAPNPSAIINKFTITGLATSETVLSLDFRPFDGRLYILTTANKLYYVHTITGAATLVSTLNGCQTAAATHYSMDFDPVADRLRLVSNTGDNFVINVDSGECTSGPTTSGGTIVAVAYSNNFRGTADTTLFAIDLATSSVGTLDINTAAFSPVINNIAGSTNKITAITGLDAVGDVLYASIQVGTARTSYLTMFNITTSQVISTIATIGDKTPVRAISAALSNIEKTMFGLSTENKLIRFESEDPTSIISTTITGLPADVNLIGMDFRTLDFYPYALSKSSLVFRINPFTSVATQVGTTLNCTFAGENFAVDWNPTLDLLRVISDTGKNYRVNVNSSTCIEDTDITPSGIKISAAAHTGSYIGQIPHTTTLYAFDYAGDTFGTIPSPNEGAYTATGTLSPQIGAITGFDIFEEVNYYIPYGVVCIEQGDSSFFMTIDINSGRLFYVGQTGNVKIKSLSASFSRLAYSYNGVYPDILLLTDSSPQSILMMNSTDPSSFSVVTLTGLDAGVKLIGMDMRPKTGDIVSIGTDSHVYIINPLTGATYKIAKMSMSILSVTTYQMGFDPAADSIRVISLTSDNFGCSPDTGYCTGYDALYSDGGTVLATGIAFTNSVKGASSSTGYVIDSANYNLLKFVPIVQGSANNLQSVGPTLKNFRGEITPMDIFSNDNQQLGFTVLNGMLSDVNLGSGLVQPYAPALTTAHGSIVGLVAVPKGYVPPSGIPTAAPSSGSGVPTTTTTTGGDSSSSASAVSVFLALLMCTSLLVIL